MTKRILAAALFLAAGKLKAAGEWCGRKSLKLLGFSTAAPPPPPMEMAGGCLDCGSMFAVKAEFEAHQCPKRR